VGSTDKLGDSTYATLGSQSPTRDQAVVHAPGVADNLTENEMTIKGIQWESRSESNIRSYTLTWICVGFVPHLGAVTGVRPRL